MKFIGVNSLRINRETVTRTLIDSFSRSLIGNDLEAVKVKYHDNGDVTLIFQPPSKAPKPVTTSTESKS